MLLLVEKESEKSRDPRRALEHLFGNGVIWRIRDSGCCKIPRAVNYGSYIVRWLQLRGTPSFVSGDRIGGMYALLTETIPVEIMSHQR